MTKTRPVRRERLAFRAAVGVLALHAAADAFIWPEPGTRVRDHLVTGLVPLAVLAVLGWLAPGWRAGLFGALALALGALAAVPAGIALAHANGAGIGGDDWTGLLCGIAAGVLLAVGVRVLWRSRRREGRRVLRRGLLVAGGALAAFWIVLPIGLAWFATHRPRSEEPRPELGAAVEDVRIETADGLRLAGWYVPSRNGAAVILFPTRRGSQAHARMLVRAGYGVLALDARGYDGSEGDPNTFGWGARRDLDAAVAFLRSRPGVRDDAIGGLGLSVGGEGLLEAAAANDGLRAVVSEGAGERSVRETAARGASAAFVLPQQAVLTASVALFSGDKPPPSLLDLLPRIAPRSVFLVYAAHGQGGEDLQPEYFAAAGEPKELWRVETGGHTGGIKAEPAEYERRVVGFFDAALLAGR